LGLEQKGRQGRLLEDDEADQPDSPGLGLVRNGR